MHDVEDILMHGLDDETGVFADIAHFVNKFGEVDVQLIDIDEHNHREIILEDTLGDVDDVGAVICAAVCNFCDDAHRVLTGDGDNCFHFMIILSWTIYNFTYILYYLSGIFAISEIHKSSHIFAKKLDLLRKLWYNIGI